MKNKNFAKKLSLTKNTVANLGASEMQAVQGGELSMKPVCESEWPIGCTFYSCERCTE